jgi:putative ABC transport system permease protein
MGDERKVSLQIRRGGRVVTYRDRRTNPNVRARRHGRELSHQPNFEMAAGRNLGPDDVEFGRPVVILGGDMVDRNSSSTKRRSAKLVRIDGQNYTVSACWRRRAPRSVRARTTLAITPITQFLDTYGRSDALDQSMNVQALNQAELAATGQSRRDDALVRGSIRRISMTLRCSPTSR